MSIPFKKISQEAKPEPTPSPSQLDVVPFIGNLTEKQFAQLSPIERNRILLQAEYLAAQYDRDQSQFFIPNGAQEEWIRSIGSPSQYRIFINCSANAVGKTSGTINILRALIWGPQNKWFNYPRYMGMWNAPKKIWYISEADSFQNKISDEFIKWFPRDRYVFTKGNRKFLSVLRSDTGWTLDAKTFDQSPRQFESADIGVVVCDEPPPRELYRAAVSRLRLGGVIIMPMTPLFHSAWVKDELVDDPAQFQYVKVFYSDVEINCKQHGVRGILDHEQIEFLMNQYDPEEREARVKGKFMHLSGAIFKTLHPEAHKHTIPPAEFTQDKHEIYCAMDIHDRKPPAIIWGAVDRFGKKYIVDEFPNDPQQPYHTIKSTDLTYSDIAKIIKEIEKKNGWDSDKIMRVMDPNYGRRQVQALGIRITDFFADKGLFFFTEVNDDLVEGHALIRDALGIGIDQEPMLRIGENCFNTWYQMLRYTYKKPNSKRADDDGIGEREGKKYADFPAVVRYFLMVAEKPDMVEQAKEAAKTSPREYDVPRDTPDAWNHDWRNPKSKLIVVRS